MRSEVASSMRRLVASTAEQREHRGDAREGLVQPLDPFSKLAPVGRFETALLGPRGSGLDGVRPRLGSWLGLGARFRLTSLHLLLGRGVAHLPEAGGPPPVSSRSLRWYSSSRSTIWACGEEEASPSPGSAFDPSFPPPRSGIRVILGARVRPRRRPPARHGSPLGRNPQDLTSPSMRRLRREGVRACSGSSATASTRAGTFASTPSRSAPTSRPT